MRSASRLRKHRERLACSACRQRKLKCDRESPCGSCIRRRDTTSCSYEASIDDLDRDRLRRTQAQARLEHLEHLVGLLAEQRSSTTIGAQYSTPAVELPHDPDTGEHTIASSSSRSDQAGSGTTHWSAMLDDIQALRSTLDPLEGNDMDDGDTSAPQADVGMGMDVMFGAGLSQAVSIEHVLNTHLPSRRSTDRLFQRQYEAFWSDPSAASPLWISILFSILFIAANISRNGTENEIPGHGFAVAAAQCLALGEYFRPKAFCFEALLLYLHSRFMTCLEISPDMGALLSVLAHIATVSGYHRESSVSSMSPFTAEMRRRGWSMFMQLDLLVSFHLGVPSRITLSVSDTRAPSNLLDSDFDEHSARLPSPRPDSEVTSVTFCIIKHKFMTIFGKILQHALVNPSHEVIDAQIDSLDAELKHLYGSLPELYRPRPIQTCIIDHPQLIVARLFYEECRPGGQLDTEEWLMKSITWHDFLLGVTTLCLVAHATSQITEGFHIDQLSVKLLLERVRTMLQTENSEDGARARSRVLSIVEATISRLWAQQSSEGMQTTADIQASPNGTEEMRWENGEAHQHETNWDYLDELLDASHHGIFTPAEV
ncbi:related to transcription activator protein acu-15 [Fusarium mangiferae]|uniref:Related to transcription activator protein acu-15 n=1 Tax=Fusarium mangiferae TaxID=192010 RepID=A0A1L7U3B5_FUSMA|nr:uncharacterized protein FMAN_10849 [Fusarium mangiferae]CVL05290.1 related to transcription activator protein acu-15 [Fusarium mangiferae]